MRIARILLGIIAGAGLSVSGVIFQALLRNPLAEPYVLGFSFVWQLAWPNVSYGEPGQTVRNRPGMYTPITGCDRRACRSEK